MRVVGLVHVHPRQVETVNDIADVTAPAPIKSGDIVATAEDVYTVEVVLASTDGPVVPVLARRAPGVALLDDEIGTGRRRAASARLHADSRSTSAHRSAVDRVQAEPGQCSMASRSRRRSRRWQQPALDAAVLTVRSRTVQLVDPWTTREAATGSRHELSS